MKVIIDCKYKKRKSNNNNNNNNNNKKMGINEELMGVERTPTALAPSWCLQ